MGVSSWDGTLSSRDFHIFASAFAEKWQRMNPTLPSWAWVTLPKLPWTAKYEVEGYLSLEKLCFLRYSEDNHNEVSHKENEGPLCSNEEPLDNAVLVQSYHHEVHYCDLHIVYSVSYKVPVLYFRAYSSDGQYLVLDDIEKHLPASSEKVVKESKWTFITQEEHPYLKRPWYTLHPCGTSEWMKLLFLGDAAAHAAIDELYLVSWLSVVGQVVGLKIPFEMLKLNSS
ncbi:ubiquitin-like-conjugating enzyme ATG10 isoform X2 [Malania oleifera]|uniref:ubiquitin-like-conjugating enzyme ATG10 isoform X2 n=1 Tax=Malania oleifera TaxID=397392 RepID=UPI0025ADDC68|nr:ubiquitin-like-conjugating enzyme ATG10 isoform X2 [Malania oleifera]